MRTRSLKVVRTWRLNNNEDKKPEGSEDMATNNNEDKKPDGSEDITNNNEDKKPEGSEDLAPIIMRTRSLKVVRTWRLNNNEDKKPS